MGDTAVLAWALWTGALIGALFFGGLWWTVRKSATSHHPARLFLSSYLLRTSISLAGFYFVAEHHWESIPALLLGFIIARIVITKLAAPPVNPRTCTVKESGHAS